MEVSDETATYVLSGTVSPSDVRSMRLACRAVPARVRTLRLNLGDVDGLDAQVMDAVRGVVRDWRASRGGDFRLDLTTPHLVARMEERRDAPSSSAGSPTRR
jgi:hypothetical protein